MELTKLNQWLSVIANLGVLAGIVFLAFELQQNSNLARAGAFQQLTQEITEVRSWIIADDDLRRNWEIYSNGDSLLLEDDDISKISFIVRSMFGTYENAFYSYRLGIITESEWSRFEDGLCRHYNRYGEDRRLGGTPATDEFRDHAAGVCPSYNE